MEVKKSPKADLENKKSIFMLLGLCIALGLVIYMFSLSKSTIDIAKLDQKAEIVEIEQVEITRQEEPKVEPPKVAAPVVSDILQVVDNKIETKNDLSAFETEGGDDVQIVIRDVGGKEEDLMAEDAPVIVAEVMPTFQGGDLNTFRSWVGKTIKYPSVAEENNITGRVTVRFVVEKDGSVTKVEALASPDKSLSEEAIRVVSSSPKWTPGEQRGKKVRVFVIVPVVFTL